MGKFVEGRVYTNPKTGQPLRRVNGGWVPATKTPAAAPGTASPTAAPASNPALTGVRFPTLLPAEYRPGVEPTQILEPNADATPMQRTPEPQAPAPQGGGGYNSAPPDINAGGNESRSSYLKKRSEWAGKYDADFMAKSRTDAVNAAQMLPTLDDIENLVNDAPVGAYAGMAEGVGKFIPEGWWGSDADDKLQSIRAKVNQVILPKASMLKGNFSDKDMKILMETLGDTNSSRGALLSALKLIRRESRAAIIKQRELQRWVTLKGDPSTPDSQGRTFEDAWQEFYTNPATIKELEAPGERTKSQQPKNAPLNFFKDRNGQWRSR